MTSTTPSNTALQSGFDNRSSLLPIGHELDP